MPNIVGIWDPELSEASIRRTLATQLHRVRVPNIGYDEYVEAHAGFGMALQDHGILENGPQPVRSDDGRLSLLLDGEIFNTDELQRLFRHDLRRCDLSPPALCLELIALKGKDVARSFNGLFCIVLYDREARRLTLISDRYGFRPLYYVRRNGTLIFGSELKALCATDPQPRRIDETGTLEFFCYGSHVMHRTWLQGYLRLLPASIFTMDESGVHSRTYWTYRYEESAPQLDQPTYYTVLRTLMDRAVERCMKGSHRIGIFLSGGYDSRAVAAAIREHHFPLPAFTFGHPESRDVRYAAMLAERLGLEHHKLTEGEPHLYWNCRAIVWRTEGMSSIARVTSIRHHARMKQTMDIFLTGFLGEFSGSHTWPKLLLVRSRQAAIKTIFDRMVRGRLGKVRRVFQPAFFERSFAELRTHFERSFEAVQNDHPLDMADCWNFMHLHPRDTYHAPSLDRYLLEARAPHMDTELVDFLLTIPPYARVEQRVYKKMIAYGFPEIRDVPCTNSGLPINPNFAAEYTAMVARYLRNRVWAPVQRVLGVERGLGREIGDPDEEFRAEPELADKVLQPLLRAQVFPAQIFDHAGIDQIIDEHYSGAHGHWEVLSMLISWGLAAEFFLHDDLSQAPAHMYAP